VLRLAFNYLKDGPAKDFLWSLWNTNGNTMLSGAWFPDWEGFAGRGGCTTCGGVSEVSHWPAFMAAYIDQARPMFLRNPRTSSDLTSLAFLFGVIAHDEADIPWHFPLDEELPSDTNDPVNFSFLSRSIAYNGSDSMTSISCHQLPDYNPNKPHGCMEFVVDWLILDSSRGAWWDEMSSYLPKADIEAVYQTMGKTVTDTQLDQARAGFIQVSGYEKDSVLAFPFQNFRNQTWTVNNYMTYTEGGVYDMAYHVAMAWQQAYDELSTPIVVINHVRLFQAR
jgi:hypothetical protein